MTWRVMLEIACAVIAIGPAVTLLMFKAGSIRPGTLRYGGGLRVFSVIAAACLAVFVIGATSSVLNGPAGSLRTLGWPVLFVPLSFGGIAWLLGDAWWVRHRFDREGVDYRSPWSPPRRFLWSEITALRWRPAVQWLDFTDHRGHVFHFSTMLGGLNAFAALAIERVPHSLGQQHPVEFRVLEAIQRGRAVSLSGIDRL